MNEAVRKYYKCGDKVVNIQSEKTIGHYFTCSKCDEDSMFCMIEIEITN